MDQRDEVRACCCFLSLAEERERLKNHEVTTIGRGGAGNLRFPSKDARAIAEAASRIDRRYVKELHARQGEQTVRPTLQLPCSSLPFSLHSIPGPFPPPVHSNVNHLPVLDWSGWSRESAPFAPPIPSLAAPFNGRFLTGRGHF